jgi:hypothetical protein
VTVGDTPYWTFTQAVRLGVSFQNPEVTGTSVVLGTNRVAWGAQRIITLYLQRWTLETAF